MLTIIGFGCVVLLCILGALFLGAKLLCMLEDESLSDNYTVCVAFLGVAFLTGVVVLIGIVTVGGGA